MRIDGARQGGSEAEETGVTQALTLPRFLSGKKKIAPKRERGGEITAADIAGIALSVPKRRVVRTRGEGES